MRYPVLLALALVACSGGASQPPSPAPLNPAPEGHAADTMDELSRKRLGMITDQLLARDIVDGAVLEAMRTVPRHRFVPADAQAQAYADHPVPLAHGATVSQPYIVALMTQLARVKPGDRVLEIGTGSGYQAAVLAAVGAEVYSLEVVPELAAAAERTLTDLGYSSVHVRHGDGYRGWPEHAPYAAILVTAAAPSLPKPLTEQLAVGGRLVIPLGRGFQDLQVLERHAHDLHTTSVIPVQFVPMTGEVESVSRRAP